MTENYLNILADTIRNNWDKPALTDFYLTEDGTAQDTSRGNHFTYGEMYAEIVRVADLLTRLGLQKGDHIAICGANSAHWVIAYLAIAKMQGVSVTIMHSLQSEQIAQMINFSDAKALFTDEELWAELKEKPLPQVKNVISLANWNVMRGENISLPFTGEELCSIERPVDGRRTMQEVGLPHTEPDSLAMICFTSGSSGKPKGVMLPYRSLNANIAIKFEDFIKSKGRISLSWLPNGHIYGLLAEVLQPMCIGISVVIFCGQVNAATFLNLVGLVKPAIIMTVPVVLESIIGNLKLYTSDICVLREKLLALFGAQVDLIGVGGALLSNELEEVLYSPEVPLGMSYGMTECGPRIALALAHELKPHTVGIILPTLTGRIAPNGEILVKGENVMLGYYKDPEATAQKIDKDGWLHTGDKGHLDEDGYLYVEGRLEQDIIVLPNGENIRPDTIEALINALPEVSESIVLERDGKLVAIVVAAYSLHCSTTVHRTLDRAKLFTRKGKGDDIRRTILRAINPQLPLFSQLYDVEITDQPLARTEKQTLKRYLYK